MIISFGARAQDISPASKNSFANWVIESNVNTPKNSVVKFYNAKQDVIYQEEIKGKKLNVNRKSVRNRLNRVLFMLTEKSNYAK